MKLITSSKIPKGLRTPAAMGIPSKLYMLANKKFNRIRFTVFLDRSKHATTSSKSFLISTTSAASAKMRSLIKLIIEKIYFILACNICSFSNGNTNIRLS